MTQSIVNRTFRGAFFPALIAAALTGPVGAAEGEEEPLETDRPDITETSTVVGPGRFQIETSLLRAYQDHRRHDERSLFTPTLFRYGFSDRWEARLETDGYSSTHVAGRRTSGYSPLAPGFKYHIQDPREGSRRPSLGAILHFTVPSGSGEFSTDKLLGDLKLAADWDLAPRWALGMNLGLVIDEDDDGDTFASGLLTASLARDLTDRLRTFAEIVVGAPETGHGGTGLLFDGGFVYLLDPNNQIDFAIGTGLSGRTLPDLFWTVGYSRRF